MPIISRVKEFCADVSQMVLDYLIESISNTCNFIIYCDLSPLYY
eukprot:05984.XXX_128717_128848_1 [CDS] Oithona nana genome sequencing.